MNLKNVDIRDVGFSIGTLREGENAEKLLPVVKAILYELEVAYVDSCCNEINTGSPLSEIMTTLDSATLTNGILSIQYTGEDGVPQIKTVDLKGLVPQNSILEGSYDEDTNTLTLVKADGTTIEIPINELTSFSGLVAGHPIATYKDENGASTVINETITSYTSFITP
jgi:hypothetical protein